MSKAETLRSPGSKLGFWCASGDPMVLESAAAVQPDWICIDTQHGVALDRLDASLLTAVASYGPALLIRVPAIDASAIGRALDLGADGIVVPLVEDHDDAVSAVAATRHAPMGNRSFGMQTPRRAPLDDVPFVAIQIETAAAIANLDAIANVDGVDALYVGPADLGLGLTGQAESDLTRALAGDSGISDALTRVVAACREAHIKPGLHCPDGTVGANAAQAGFEMMAVASDTASIASNLTAQLQRARN